jgi:hypothetical protein
MQGEGTGVIELNDGKVTGGDTALAYTGSYVVDGDNFTAFIATERHTPGQPPAPTRPRSPASVILNPSRIARDARSKK